MNVITAPIEFVLNLALAQDPETQEKLDQFDDRHIRIYLSDLESTLLIAIKKRQFFMQNHANETADLIITTDTSNLIKLIRQPNHLFSSEFDIKGDVQFAKQLSKVLHSFDFDWEAQLARLTGDTLAYPIAYNIRQGLSWLNKNYHALQLSTAEYLKEETPHLAQQITG